MDFHVCICINIVCCTHFWAQHMHYGGHATFSGYLGVYHLSRLRNLGNNMGFVTMNYSGADMHLSMMVAQIRCIKWGTQ